MFEGNQKEEKLIGGELRETLNLAPLSKAADFKNFKGRVEYRENRRKGRVKGRVRGLF